MVTFKINSLLTCGFDKGEIRTSDEFPKGTDFQRLIELGVIRSTKLGGHTGPPSEAELLDQIEELSDKLGKTEETHEEFKSRASEKVNSLQTENELMKARLAELELKLAVSSSAEPAKPEEAKPEEEAAKAESEKPVTKSAKSK